MFCEYQEKLMHREGNHGTKPAYSRAETSMGRPAGTLSIFAVQVQEGLALLSHQVLTVSRQIESSLELADRWSEREQAMDEIYH